MRIPQGALKTVLRRATRSGYVKRAKGVYVRNDDKVANLDFGRVRSDVLRSHGALVQKLREFCASKYQIDWSQEAAEAALLSYLQESSTPVLAAAVEGQPIPKPDRPIKHADFLVNAFVKHLFESDPEGFDFLETIVKGNMLANVLLYPDLGEVEQRFERVEVYLDTTVLLRALGLAGERVQAPYLELIDLLYEENAELRCFEHTLEEVYGILDAAARTLRDRTYSGVHGETIEYFINSGYRPSDVEDVIAHLERSLRNLHVKVKPKPSHTIPLSLDEARLETMLQQKIQYSRPVALRHDLDSLTAIYRLRGGRTARKIEECGAIFATANPKLEKTSREFFEADDNGVRMVPHCILDHLLTTLVWLKKPLQAPNLPRKTIIANCYAALNGSGSLWRQYLEEISRLQEKGDISEEDYYLLRFSMEARSALMDLTLGEADAFTEGTVEEVLDRAQKAARAETEAALREETKKREEAEQRAARAEAGAEAQLRSQRDKIRSVAMFGGRLVANTAFYIGVLFLILAAYLTFTLPFPTLPGQFWQLLVSIILVLFALATLLNMIFGTTLKSLVRRLEARTSRLIEKKLTEFMGI